MNRAEFSVNEQFQTFAQQREAVHLAMWLFLATEVIMFGGLIFAIWYYRLAYQVQVDEAVSDLHYLLAGTNSVLLLTSSLTMTLAVHCAREGLHRRLQGWLLVSVALATAFLVLKGFEYHAEFVEGLLPPDSQASPLPPGPGRLFMGLYLVSTGLHAVHILVAILLALGIGLRLRLGRLQVPQRMTVIEVFGLYWHVVDVIWIFLYPSLYLIGRPL